MDPQLGFIVLSCLSVVTGLIAALLWVRSACVKTPENFAISVAPAEEPFGEDPPGGTHVGHGYSPKLVALANALQQQSKLSGWAAVLTAVAVIFQMCALVIQIFIVVP
jgi:hypothetical protein